MIGIILSVLGGLIAGLAVLAVIALGIGSIIILLQEGKYDDNV